MKRLVLIFFFLCSFPNDLFADELSDLLTEIQEISEIQAHKANFDAFDLLVESPENAIVQNEEFNKLPLAERFKALNDRIYQSTGWTSSQFLNAIKVNKDKAFWVSFDALLRRNLKGYLSSETGLENEIEFLNQLLVEIEGYFEGLLRAQVEECRSVVKRGLVLNADKNIKTAENLENFLKIYKSYKTFDTVLAEDLVPIEAIGEDLPELLSLYYRVASFLEKNQSRSSLDRKPILFVKVVEKLPVSLDHESIKAKLSNGLKQFKSFQDKLNLLRGGNAAAQSERKKLVSSFFNAVPGYFNTLPLAMQKEMKERYTQQLSVRDFKAGGFIIREFFRYGEAVQSQVMSGFFKILKYDEIQTPAIVPPKSEAVVDASQVLGAEPLSFVQTEVHVPAAAGAPESAIEVKVPAAAETLPFEVDEEFTPEMVQAQIDEMRRLSISKRNASVSKTFPEAPQPKIQLNLDMIAARFYSETVGLSYRRYPLKKFTLAVFLKAIGGGIDSQTRKGKPKLILPDYLSIENGKPKRMRRFLLHVLHHGRDEYNPDTLQTYLAPALKAVGLVDNPNLIVNTDSAE